MLTQLAKQNLILRERSGTAAKDDSRSVTVKLTAKGRRLTAKLMPLYRDYDELTMRGFSPEVRATLKAALSRVVQNVTQAC